MIDPDDELPNVGAVYAEWAELADLYETGKTLIADAHAALRRVASRWLDRPSGPDATFIEQGVSDAADVVGALFERDGNWGHGPS